MNLFPINHPRGGFRKRCLAGRCATPGNQINLALVTETQWEDGLWLIHIGPDHYRVHGEDNMKALETALELTRPKADE